MWEFGESEKLPPLRIGGSIPHAPISGHMGRQRPAGLGDWSRVVQVHGARPSFARRIAAEPCEGGPSSLFDPRSEIHSPQFLRLSRTISSAAVSSAARPGASPGEAVIMEAKAVGVP